MTLHFEIIIFQHDRYQNEGGYVSNTVVKK